jgi:alkylation response protein AidB-like acyl-CoA dehydrogenase
MLLAAPTIAHNGTPEQIARWVPSILDGTESWCQLFSEPGSGSDLAGLQTKAVRDGDEWIITGQKVWTSMGAEADWGMLIARTDPDLPKHQGITYFGFPMDQPGVEVRPLTEMTGRALFNEVFLEEARVHNDNIIGERGSGWRVANSTLMFERSGIGGGHGGGYGSASPGKIVGHLDRRVGDFLGKSGAIGAGAVGRRVLGLLSDEAAARGKANDAVIRDKLARLHMLHRITSMTVKRQAAERKSGRKNTGLGAGVEGNLAKIANTKQIELARDLAGDILGPDAVIVGKGAATAGYLQELILFSPAPPIYGGTDEIQRNVIGERGLGLPKEPGPSKDTPFTELPK